jgi:3-methylfumaryl-CoA hydratase
MSRIAELPSISPDDDGSETPFAEWIGRESHAEDAITPRLVSSYRAIFGQHLASGDTAPLGIHWCLSPPIVEMEALGIDGHPASPADLPAIDQPRRMWAGGRVEFISPLHEGDVVRRTSIVTGVTCKQGRSGELWFVTLDRTFTTGRGVAIRERQDIVYRGASSPSQPGAAARVATPVGLLDGGPGMETTPALLFRYSAITFNAHRIHYDLPYATAAEGYPGLVVHGPLQATFLMNAAAKRLGSTPAAFAYRSVAPCYVGTTLQAHGPDGDRMRVQGTDGTVHMEAVVERRAAVS